MSTTYTISYNAEGWITSVESRSDGNSRKAIKHPIKGDIFYFVNTEADAWAKVTIKCNTPGISDSELFGSAEVTIGAPATVQCEGLKAEFAFTPKRGSDGPGERPPGDISPPDTGTIKVGS